MEELTNVGFTIASVLCVIVIAFGYSRYAAKVGRQINSPSLVADAEHIGVDLFSSVAVLARPRRNKDSPYYFEMACRGLS